MENPLPTPPVPIPSDLPPYRQSQLAAILQNERNHRYRNTDPNRVQTVPQGTTGIDPSLNWRGKPGARPRRSLKSQPQAQ